MAVKKQGKPPVEIFPLLKTVEQMSKISGIGEHKLRELMDAGEIEFVQNGNRRLLCKMLFGIGTTGIKYPSASQGRRSLWLYHPVK